MRQSWPIYIFSSVVAILILCAIASAQVSLQDQLAAQYKVAQMAGGGSVVVESGTVLVVQKAGIKAMPFRAIPKCAAKYEGGTLHLATGFLCTSAIALQDYFQKGKKVYPLKIEVNQGKEKITFRVVSCDECNGVDPPTGLKGDVEFQFPQGYLEKASAGEVEDTIGQVFAISDDDQQEQASAQDQGQSQDQPSAAPQRDPQPASQPAPQDVQLGMTTSQVLSAVGQPLKIFTVGSKQIFVYKDVKVTFIDSKVSDVQ